MKTYEAKTTGDGKHTFVIDQASGETICVCSGANHAAFAADIVRAMSSYFGRGQQPFAERGAVNDLDFWERT